MVIYDEAACEELARRAKEKMPSEEFLGEMCDMLKILGEPSRMKIAVCLMQGEMCVFHIVQAVGGSQSAVSQQLRVLKNGKLLKSRRAGKNVLYSIADEHVYKIVEMSMEHAAEFARE